jgi:hypothetical protein
MEKKKCTDRRRTRRETVDGENRTSSEDVKHDQRVITHTLMDWTLCVRTHWSAVTSTLRVTQHGAEVQIRRVYLKEESTGDDIWAFLG